MLRTDNLYITWLLVFVVMFASCSAQSGASGPEQAFTLRTGVVDGRMVYIGVDGTIDDVVNPDLVVRSSERVRIDIMNSDGVSHDLAIPDLAVRTPLGFRDQTVSLTFVAQTGGVYSYLCTVAGHRQVGMEGRLVVTP